MVDSNTLYIIKSNITVISYISSSVSFLFGISPLIMDKESVSKHNTPFWIEVSAAFLLVFNIFMFSLDSFADKPMFPEQYCLTLKKKYFSRLEFADMYDRKVIKIVKIGSNNYLVQNQESREKYELPIRDDFRYKETECLR
jgi:hypothetical protein